MSAVTNPGARRQGFKRRGTMLPRTLVPAPRRQIQLARSLHRRDLAAGAPLGPSV